RHIDAAEAHAGFDADCRAVGQADVGFADAALDVGFDLGVVADFEPDLAGSGAQFEVKRGLGGDAYFQFADAAVDDRAIGVWHLRQQHFDLAGPGVNIDPGELKLRQVIGRLTDAT